MESESILNVHCDAHTHTHTHTVSTGTLPHTCLFPQSSVAFMIVPMKEILTVNNAPSHENNSFPHINAQLLDNLLSFSKLRHKCYVLLCAPLMSTNEQKIFSLMEQKFLMEDLQFVPVHNSKECMEYMTSIAKVTCKPLSTIIRQRYEKVKHQLLTEENVISILQEMVDVTERESVLLLDGCGGLGGIGRISVEELIDYNLDAGVARDMHSVLHGKS